MLEQEGALLTNRTLLVIVRFVCYLNVGIKGSEG
jgi:hypothetical protein